jgi:hypothetical protein
MPRGTLVVDAKLLKDHFLRKQHGGNIAGYRGARFQRGYGIGGIFKSLARYAIPLFKQGAKVVGKRALKAATEVGQDVLQGKNVRESARLAEERLLKTLPKEEQRPYYIRRARKQEKARPTQSTAMRLKLCSHIAVPRRTK